MTIRRLGPQVSDPILNEGTLVLKKDWTAKLAIHRPGKRNRWPHPFMEVGDYYETSYQNATTSRSSAFQYGARSGTTFVTRTIHNTKDERVGVRVIRVA